MRVPILSREKVAIINFRRHHTQINHISKVFQRSTSVISRILKTYEKYYPSFKIDLRKTPDYVKKLNTKRRLKRAYLYLFKYEKFLNGEGEKPP